MTLANATRSTPALSPAIQKTLLQTFVTVGALLGATAVASFLTMGLKLGIVPLLSLFVVSLVVLYGVHKNQNSGIGLALLGVFALIQGVTLGPMLSHYLAMPSGLTLILSAAGLTATATFACAAYAIVSRKDFSKMGSFLFAALIVVLVASVVGMFLQIAAFTLVVSGACAILFTLWLLYDVGQIVNGTQTNYISASTSIFLDIINLFTSLLRILGILPGGDN